MKPAPFSYSRPASVSAAVDGLRPAATVARILAGGQSLVPMLNLRLAPVDALLDIRGLNELRTAKEQSDAILYGALLTHAMFEDRKVPDGSNGLIPHVAARIAFRSVRNRGTLGGALALADPAADWLTTMVALQARMHITGLGGPRIVAAEQFVLGAYLTALEDGEILTHVEVPKRPATEHWGYNKVTVKAGEYAESLAIALYNSTQRTARITLGAAAGAPLMLTEAARALLDNASDDQMHDVVRAELAASGRSFSPARLIMHTTTVLRAARDAKA